MPMDLKALTRELRADERPQLLAPPSRPRRGGPPLQVRARDIVMDAKTVAQEGYRACMAGKPVHVAGIANELAVQWIKYQPGWLMRAFGGVFGKSRDA